jgi:hypothetical protein
METQVPKEVMDSEPETQKYECPNYVNVYTPALYDEPPPVIQFQPELPGI